MTRLARGREVIVTFGSDGINGEDFSSTSFGLVMPPICPETGTPCTCRNRTGLRVYNVLSGTANAEASRRTNGISTLKHGDFTPTS